MNKLLNFATKIIKLCKTNDIELILYGSYLVKHYTKDKKLKINDIDLYVHEKDYKKIIPILEKNKIKFEYSKKGHTLIITENKLKVELDSIEFWYNGPKKCIDFDFNKEKIKALSLEGLKHIYKKASEVSDKKEQNKIKYELLEKVIIGIKPFNEKTDLKYICSTFADLYKTNFDEKIPKARYDEMKKEILTTNNKDNFCLVYYVDEKPIGYVHYIMKKDKDKFQPKIIVSMVYIDKKHRGKGYTKKLFEEIEKFAKKNKYNKIALNAFPVNYELYKKWGFETKSYWMEKKI